VCPERPGDVEETIMADDRVVYRHKLWLRATHWINVVCMTGLLMSGLQIFNAHPALYWGDYSNFDAPIFAIGAENNPQGRAEGVTTIGDHSFDTTGVLGLSGDPRDPDSVRGFPAWATLPSAQWLAMGRRWHFFFAWLFVINGAIYAISSLVGRHLRRDLVPSRGELAHIPRSLWDHLRLRFPKGEEVKHYNVIQKLSYLIVAFLLGPVMILAGLAMSPRLDASYPILLEIFGGRQSARTIHFIIAFSFLGFVVIHLVMVLVSDVWNNLRSMVTGWYDIGDDHEKT
jgi:thiosulfate reductase cytochrome b subunit